MLPTCRRQKLQASTMLHVHACAEAGPTFVLRTRFAGGEKLAESCALSMGTGTFFLWLRGLSMELGTLFL